MVGWLRIDVDRGAFSGNRVACLEGGGLGGGLAIVEDVGPGAVGKLEAPLPPSIVSRAPSTVRASAPAVAHVPNPIGIAPIMAMGMGGTAPGTGIAGATVAELPLANGGGVA